MRSPVWSTTWRGGPPRNTISDERFRDAGSRIAPSRLQTTLHTSGRTPTSTCRKLGRAELVFLQRQQWRHGNPPPTERLPICWVSMLAYGDPEQRPGHIVVRTRGFRRVGENSAADISGATRAGLAPFS